MKVLGALFEDYNRSQDSRTNDERSRKKKKWCHQLERIHINHEGIKRLWKGPWSKLNLFERIGG